MCGIAGIYHFQQPASNFRTNIEKAGKALSKRGPDNLGQFYHDHVGLLHARLSILDTSMAGAQPMSDTEGRYTIVFNGEIYNYKELQAKYLADKGIEFRSTSDTEVLLYLYKYLGKEMLQELNGFFAFAIYDQQDQSLFIARDRIGIKPLLVYRDAEQIIFASEMKALLSFPIKRELDPVALRMYLQLNYTPAPLTMLKRISKLDAGSFMTVAADGKVHTEKYYTIPRTYLTDPYNKGYEQAKADLIGKLEASVQKRLISDVPLGAFLSGGIDSSAIVALATRHSPHINTFSIGFKDEPFFDETHYAELVAKKFKTQHTTFSLSNNDLYEHLFDILDYLDEPFADSSAIAVYILCKQTRQKATVALSGDGADEMFGGYNKHYAEYKALQGGVVNELVKASSPLLGMLPRSRNSKLGNLFRQLDRFATGMRMSADERYWRWCSFIDEAEALQLLGEHTRQLAIKQDAMYRNVKSNILAATGKDACLNDVLYTDMHLVLQNDMLTKVDLMSMASSLEVRVPFLDHHVVDFAFSLPNDYKVYKGFKKRVVKDAFKDILPEELYTRPKHGFEVPLLKWFRGDLRSLIEDDLLNDAFVEEQGIFDPIAVKQLKAQLYSNDPGEVHARIWGLIVFQYWWKKYLA